MNYSFPFEIEDVAAVTGNRVNRKISNNWSNDLRWFFPMAPYRPGRPRPYSRLALIEAAIASAAMSFGIPRSAVTYFFQARAGRLGAPSSGWGGKDNVVEFPEFAVGSKDWFWMCFVTLDVDGKSFGQAGMRAHHGVEALAADLVDVNPNGDESAIFILKISEIVARVDTYIASRG